MYPNLEILVKLVRVDISLELLIFFGQTSGLHLSILFFTPPKLQTSDFGRSDRYCHYKSDIYIIIPRMCRSEE